MSTCPGEHCAFVSDAHISTASWQLPRHEPPTNAEFA